MARDRFQSSRPGPLFAWIAIGVLLVVVAGLLATYALRPGRSPADDERTAAAIGEMDAAQKEADERREEKRSSSALLD